MDENYVNEVHFAPMFQLSTKRLLYEYDLSAVQQ